MNFNRMYQEHYTRVYYTALKITKDPNSAEDVLQETFIKAYEKMDEVKDEAKLGAWLATIAYRKAIDFIRKGKKIVTLPLEELPISLPSESEHISEVEKEYERISLEEGVQKKISTLSPKLRAVFQLNFYQHLKEKEIAHKLHLTHSAVKSRLHRARLEMKSQLMDVTDHNYTA